MSLIIFFLMQSKFRERMEMQEDGPSNTIGDDVYTQVMGPERHGRVRGYGLGPTPTSVFGSTLSQSRANYETMCTEFNNMRHQVEEMKMMQDRMSATIAEMMQQMSGQQQDPFESVSLLIYYLLSIFIVFISFVKG